MYSNERLFWNRAQVNCKFKSTGCQYPLCLLFVSLRTQSQRLPAETYKHHLLTASCTSKGWCLVAKPVRDFTRCWDPLQAPHLPPSTQPHLRLQRWCTALPAPSRQRGCTAVLQLNVLHGGFRGSSDSSPWSRKKLISRHCWASKDLRGTWRSSVTCSLHWASTWASSCSLRTESTSGNSWPHRVGSPLCSGAV